MSHYAVLVTGTNEDIVDYLLEPFIEEVDENSPYAEKDYWLERDEQKVATWLDETIKQYEENRELYAQDPKNQKWWENAVKELKRIRNLKTLKGKLKAIQEREGGSMDEKGLYWLYNPNCKWDWWTVGGRFSNWIIDKKGKKCDVCKIKDIDWEAMQKRSVAEAEEYWTKEMDRAEKENMPPLFWGWEKTPTRDEYVADADVPPCVFAILHEGEWRERPEGMHVKEWAEKFQEFIKTLDPETEVTIVDCHI